MRQSEKLGISSSTYARWRKMGAGEIPIEKLRYISKYPRASKRYEEWEEKALEHIINKYGVNRIAYLVAKKFSAIEYDILESVFRFAIGAGRTPKAVMDRITRRVCKKRKAKKEGEK